MGLERLMAYSPLLAPFSPILIGQKALPNENAYPQVRGHFSLGRNGDPLVIPTLCPMGEVRMENQC